MNAQPYGIPQAAPAPLVERLSVSTTVRGNQYRYLYLIRRNEPEDDILALAYSALKFGYPELLRSFADYLADAILRDSSFPDAPPCIVHPGSPHSPNSAFFLSQLVASTISSRAPGTTIQHISIESPLAARPRLKVALGSGAHSGRWIATTNPTSDEDPKHLLESKPVIFIDDCALSGNVVDKYLEHLASFCVNGVTPVVLCHLAGGSDANFELDVDTRVLRRPGGPIMALVEALERPGTLLTTRLVYHAFQLAPGDWQAFVSRLSDRILLSLYLFAVNNFGSECPDMLNLLAQTVERRIGISLPGKLELSSVRSNVFFHSIENLGPTPGTLIAESDVKNVAARTRTAMTLEQHSTPVSLVLFDLDHTMLFSEKYYEAIHRIGPLVISNLTGVDIDSIHTRLAQLSRRLSETGFPMRQNDIAREFGIEWPALDKATVEAVKARDYVKEDRALLRVFEALHMAGVKTAVITDSGTYKARDVLNALGIAHSFDAVFTADATGLNKPSVEFLCVPLNHFGVTASETVMVGDSRTLDLEPAEALGMRTVLVRSRSHLLRLPDTLFSKSDALRRLSNFVTDFDGFQMHYFGGEHISRDADWDLLLRSFQRSFRTFWRGAKLDEAELYDIYCGLRDHFSSVSSEKEPSELSSSDADTDTINRTVRLSNRLLELAARFADLPNRVFIGLDGVFWQAADRGRSLLYCLDGFALSTVDELRALRPFTAQLLPEHHSIVYRVMQMIITRAIDNSDSDETFEAALASDFYAEVESASVQKTLVGELERYRDRISDIGGNGSPLYAPEIRKAYFNHLIEILSSRNVFSYKAHEIGHDFARFLSEGGLESGPITLIDRAIRGTQPLFLKHALGIVRPDIGSRFSLRLFIDPREDAYKNKAFRFLIPERIPEDIEQLRPLLKSREHRTHPLKPVYRINDLQLVDGLFTLILLSVGDNVPELGNVRTRLSAQPADSFIEELSGIAREAITAEIVRALASLSPVIDAESIKLSQAGSTSRQTHIFAESPAIPITDFDFEIITPPGNSAALEAILTHFSYCPSGFGAFFRQRGYRLTRVGYDRYEHSEAHSRRPYGKVMFLLNATGFEFLMEIIVRESYGPTYSEMFDAQMACLRLRYGDKAVDQVKREIRRLKVLIIRRGLYRDRIKYTGIPGVGVEQLVIQCGRSGNDPLVLDAPGTVQRAAEWILVAAGVNITRDLSSVRPWAKAKFDLIVHRIASEDGRSGNYLERITETEWTSLVNLALEETK